MLDVCFQERVSQPDACLIIVLTLSFPKQDFPTTFIFSTSLVEIIPAAKAIWDFCIIFWQFYSSALILRSMMLSHSLARFISVSAPFPEETSFLHGIGVFRYQIQTLLYPKDLLVSSFTNLVTKEASLLLRSGLRNRKLGVFDSWDAKGSR